MVNSREKNCLPAISAPSSLRDGVWNLCTPPKYPKSFCSSCVSHINSNTRNWIRWLPPKQAFASSVITFCVSKPFFADLGEICRLLNKPDGIILFNKPPEEAEPLSDRYPWGLRDSRIKLFAYARQCCSSKDIRLWISAADTTVEETT